LFADLALINGKVLCFDHDGKISFTEAVAIKQGKIVKVGRNAEVQKLIGSETMVINLNGKVVFPGFIDSHTHPAAYGTHLLFEVDCSKATSITEIVHIIRQKAENTDKGSWIRAYGYDQNKLVEKRHPTRWDLDEAAPNNPVILTRCCGHMSVLNSLALEKLGITKETPGPEGGVIERDPLTKELTGLLKEKANEMVLKAVSYRVDELKEGLKRAFQDLLALGVTTIHDLEVSPELIQAYQELKAEGKLPLRVNLVIVDEYSNRDLLSALSTLNIQRGFGDEWLKILGVKFFVDGSVGGRTAAFNEPYVGDPQNYGVIRIDPEILNEKVAIVHKNNLQICIHAIGDRAIDVALDAIENALKNFPKTDHRHRIEHCGVCTPKQLKRIKELGVCVSASTSFIYSVGQVYLQALGENRISWCYPHKSLTEQGIIVAENSDLGASLSANPFIGIYVLVTRKGSDDKVYGENQRVTLEEAIRAYTINAAYIGFDEKTRGSIEEGKSADLIVLSDDPFSVPVEKLKDIKVDLTIINGQIVYRRSAM